MSQLSIFDELDQEKAKLEGQKAAELQKRREEAQQPHQCHHCGEWSPNKYLLDTNHGRVFNGWCSKRLLLNNQGRAEAVEWLKSYGWEQCDSHDPANWTDDADLYWEAKK
jgi:hypothetical protein